MDIDSLLTAEGEKWRAGHQSDPQVWELRALDADEANLLAGRRRSGWIPQPWQQRSSVMVASAAAVAAIVVSAVLIGLPSAVPDTAQRGPVASSVAAESGVVRLPGDPSATLVGQAQLPRSFGPGTGYHLGPNSLIDPVDDPHYPNALIQLDALLASIPLLDGAKQSPGPSAPVLASPPGTPGSFELVARTRWFTTGRTPAEVLAAEATWLGNAPASSGGVDGVKVIYLNWPVPDLGSAQALNNVQLVVSAIAVKGKTAVRLDVQGDWVRTRPTSSMIPPDTTSLSVTINRRGHNPVKGRLTATAATAVVALLNEQQVAGSGSGGCVNLSGQDLTNPETDVVEAAVAGGTVTATVGIQGCRGPHLSIRHNDTDLPGLTGGAQIDAALLAALGLPPAG